MATHTHRTVTTTRQEWHIPANQHGHLHIGEFSRAYSAAAVAHRRDLGLVPDDPLSDDALQVTGQEDGSVVISYEINTDIAAR